MLDKIFQIFEQNDLYILQTIRISSAVWIHCKMCNINKSTNSSCFVILKNGWFRISPQCGIKRDYVLKWWKWFSITFVVFTRRFLKKVNDFKIPYCFLKYDFKTNATNLLSKRKILKSGPMRHQIVLIIKMKTRNPVTQSCIMTDLIGIVKIIKFRIFCSCIIKKCDWILYHTKSFKKISVQENKFSLYYTICFTIMQNILTHYILFINSQNKT